MKVLVKILCLLALNLTAIYAQEQNGQDVVVNISNLNNNKGKVFIALFNSETSFLNKGIKSEQIKIENKSCHVTFKNIPKGVYAISMYHDENDNNVLDKNIFGIPKETYGCSNNATGFFGPPKWEDAKFEIKEETITQHIEL
ncbi:MAG: DUF2141 domain-containing protein [Algibacter sp.]